MKCVVIGGGGFLGGAIADYLIEEGHGVVIVDRTASASKEGAITIQADIMDKKAIAKAVEGAEEVYHTAGMLGTSELNGSIQLATQVNVVGACNVFEQCIKAGVQRVFYPGKPNVWLNTYSITKQASEDFAALYHEEYDTDFIRLRWFNAYGPAQHTHPIRKIVPTFALLARFGLPIDIFGSGQNIVDMVHAKDIGKYAALATHHNLSDKVYEFGRGVPLSVIQVAKDINEVAGVVNPSITHQAMRKGETEDTVLIADTMPFKDAMFKKAKKLVVFEPWMESLKETYDWYCNELSEKDAIEALKFHGLWKE